MHYISSIPLFLLAPVAMDNLSFLKGSLEVLSSLFYTPTSCKFEGLYCYPRALRTLVLIRCSLLTSDLPNPVTKTRILVGFFRR